VGASSRPAAASYASPVVVCRSCSADNADGARFCSACGVALPDTSAREVRKTVTVLFADVTGSTALGERLDPESLRRVMARYFELAKTCLERHGGTVEKFIGDAVMAVFGVPTVHEDDALRALRAAAELRESLGPLNDELRRDYGVSLQVRTGVNTGEVVTGTEERLATGDAVNVAARLEQAAGPGEILIGDQTRALAGKAVEIEPVDALVLKGKAEPFAAHRLLRVLEGALAFDRRLDAPLVGRREELAALHSLYDEAVSSRRGRVVSVLGPPGIGKSRLAREVASELGRAANVLTGRCLPYGEGITYWPLREIFSDAGGEEELTAALEGDSPEEIFWTVRKALERRARERPLVIVVEDIHWAEPTMLDLLEHLAEWTRDAPLLLVCLARPELLDGRPAWAANSITLQPLSDDESDELIEELLAGSKLDSETRSRVRAVAEGNPLFVEQLLAMLAGGGDPKHVPPSIQALLAARLDALPDDERTVLEHASVVGLEFEWEALARLAPDGRRPQGAALSALVRKELIRPHDVIADTFRFRHLLIRDAAYERIPKELRSDLHERFADWLDGRGEEFDEIVGYHLEQAYRCLTDLGRVGDRARTLAERAADRLVAAAQRAIDRGDVAAANLLDRAASLLHADDRRRLALLPSLGRAIRDVGEMERAELVLSEAIERADAGGEAVVAADARLALIDMRFNRNLVPREDVVRTVESVIAVFEDHGNTGGLARALGLRGKLSFWAGQAASALEDLERAAGYARDADDPAQETDSLHYVLASASLGPTPVVDALARVDEIRPRAAGNPGLEGSLFENQARLEALRGNFDVARDLVTRASAIAQDYGFAAVHAASVKRAAGEVELRAGDYLAAERALRTACEALESVGELGYLASAAALLLDALYMQERDDEALLLADRWAAERLTVPEDVDAQVGWRRVYAKLLARRGDIEDAERLAREAMALAAGTDYLDLRAKAAADLAEVLRLAGRSQEAAAMLKEAIRLHEQKGNLAAAASLAALLAEPRIEA
jgi:class 3 adenylate cyclase/tetratricopeptide (TPR) repeat protein